MLSPTYPSCTITFIHSGKNLAIKAWSWKYCLIGVLKPAVAGRVLRASRLEKMDPTAATEPDASSSKQTDRWPGLPSWIRSCVATRSIYSHSCVEETWTCSTNHEIMTLPCRPTWLDQRYAPWQAIIRGHSMNQLSRVQFHITLPALHPNGTVVQTFLRHIASLTEKSTSDFKNAWIHLIWNGLLVSEAELSNQNEIKKLY